MSLLIFDSDNPPAFIRIPFIFRLNKYGVRTRFKILGQSTFPQMSRIWVGSTAPTPGYIFQDTFPLTHSLIYRVFFHCMLDYYPFSINTDLHHYGGIRKCIKYIGVYVYRLVQPELHQEQKDAFENQPGVVSLCKLAYNHCH